MMARRVWIGVLVLVCCGVSLGAAAEFTPESIPAAKLWSFPDKDSLDQYLIAHWGGNVKGVVDGQEVKLSRFPAGSMRLPNGLTVEIAEGDLLSVFYQAATQRAYIVGRARISPGGILVENDAIGPDGQPLHLNPNAPLAAPQTQGVKKESQHFVIESNLPEPFPEAILNLCETSLAGYKDLFGLDLSPKDRAQKIHVFANFSRGGALHVELSTPPEIYLDVSSDRALNPPGQGGPHNVFGFAHEFGHLTMMFDDPRFGQGFATYLGSEVVDYFQPRLGAKAWPRPYDYVTVEGMARLKSRVSTAEPGGEDAASVLLYEIAQKHGRKVIGDAVKQLSASSEFALKMDAGREYKAYHVLSFCQLLVKLTGDPAVQTMFLTRGFGPKQEPKRQSIPAAKLWSFPDKESLDQFLEERWGGNIEGVVDGNEVEMLIRWKASEMSPVKLPTGQTVEAAGDGYISIWYQPATKRTYIVGRVQVKPLGIVVENDAVGPDGQPLHLNPNAPPAPPQSKAAESQPKAAEKDNAKPESIPAAKLWSFPDKKSLDQYLEERWGGNTEGVVDGNEVQMLIRWRASTMAPVKIPTGQTLEAAGGEYISIWYQPATKRTYIVGRVRVSPGGTVVQDDAIGPDGQPLHLNPKAPPVAPQAASAVAPPQQVIEQQGHGDAAKARNIAAAELWACTSEEARTKLLKERWGGDASDTPGLLDGKEVTGVLTGFPPDKTGSAGAPNGMHVELLGGAWQYAYYQPATGRIYLIGRFRLLPGGLTVQDDAVDPEGKPLRLNPNAPPAVPPAGLVRKESTHFVMETNLSAVSPDTMLRVCEAAWEGYREIFGADFIPDRKSAKIRLSFLGFKDANMLGLLVKPEPTPVIHYGLQVEEGWQASDKALQGYYLHFTDGLGRLTIRCDNDKFNWGLAAYMRVKVADYLRQHQPADVNLVLAEKFRQESMPQAMKRIIDSHPEAGTYDAALALVCTVASKHGDKALGAAIRQVARTGRPVAALLPGVAKTHRVAELCSALVEVTGDKGLETLFKESGF